MHLLEDEGKIAALMSREAAFLLNNVVFVVFTFTVLLGTVFPLVTEAIKGVKISVGEPYFDQMAAPIGLVLVFLMGIGPILPWGRPDMKQVKEAMILPIVGAIVAAGLGRSMSAAPVDARNLCGLWLCGNRNTPRYVEAHR